MVWYVYFGDAMPRSRRRRRPNPTTDRRSPDERLEALVREPNLDRAERTLDRILNDLDAAPAPAPWISAARTLSERLIISEDAFLYFAMLFTDCALLEESERDPELTRLADAMIVIERAHRLRDDETFVVEDAPEDWRALNESWERRADAIIAQTLRQASQSDIALLFEESRAEFDRRVEKGRTDLWGED